MQLEIFTKFCKGEVWSGFHSDKTIPGIASSDGAGLGVKR